jgi:hypothetical protein
MEWTILRLGQVVRVFITTSLELTHTTAVAAELAVETKILVLVRVQVGLAAVVKGIRDKQAALAQQIQVVAVAVVGISSALFGVAAMAVLV